MLLASFPSTAEESLQKVTIQLSWKYQFEFAPIIAAYEKGFYQEAGLEVEILEGGLGIYPVDRVVNGDADYGIFSSALILEYGEGKPVVALAAIMQHSAVAIISDKPEINSVLDLADRTIAVSPDTRDEVISYLKASGISDQHIKVVEKTRWMLDDLEGNDAISAYTSNEGFFTTNNNKRYMMLTPRSEGIDLFGNILFTSQHQIDSHPEQVKAFRTATLKGLNYALDHPQELTDIILEKYNSLNKSREHLLYEAEKIKELTRPDIVEPGYMSLGRWRHVAGVYAGLGKLQPDVDLESFIYNTDLRPDLRWFYFLMGVLLLVILVVSAVLWRTRQLTQRLQKEIREREQTEKELAITEMRFKDLFDNNPDPCWLMDNGRFIECNNEAVHALGYPGKSALISLHLSDVSPPIQPDGRDSAEKANEVMIIAMEKGVHRFEWACQCLDGKVIPFEVTLAKYTMRGKDVLYCVWRDITERKRVELMKDEFVSTVSHELRTPLTSLIGSIGLIAGGVAGQLPEKAMLLLEIALNNANRLLLLINDILDLSKIEAGKLEYQMTPVEINQLIRQAITYNEEYGKKYGVRFEFTPCREEVWCYGDANRLLQVMNNLLANAAKFSNPSDKVEITTRHSGEQITILVKDYGVGIPKEAQKNVFKKFFQVDSSDTRSKGGTGLGLNISKSIIDAHNGTICFDSTPGVGTSFYIGLKAYHL